MDKLLDWSFLFMVIFALGMCAGVRMKKLVFLLFLIPTLCFAETTVNISCGYGSGTLIYEDGFGASDWESVRNSTNATDGGSRGNVSVGYIHYARSTMYAGIDNRIDRGFFVINTTDIPDDATINSARLFIRNYASVVGDNDTYAIIVVTNSSQDSVYDLNITDYQKIGTADGGSYPMHLLPPEGPVPWYSIELNATGISWINKTGWTKLGTREGHDLYDHEILNTKTNYNECFFYVNESYLYNDSAVTPYLQINYTVASADVTRSIGNAVINNAIFN